MMAHRLILTWRVIKMGFINFLRNLWLSTAATAIMLVTLMIIMTTIVFNKALNDTLAEESKNLTVSVYISDEADQSLTNSLENDLKSEENINTVEYISKEAAQNAYIQAQSADKEDLPELLDAVAVLDENPFPASFEVQLSDLTKNEGFLNVINDDKYKDVVENFDDQRIETVNTIGTTQKNIVRGGVIAGIIFAVISVLIIFNTIRMAIFARRSEIHIMQLVGATNRFIRAPFLFEASLYGVIAGSITLASVLWLSVRLENISSKIVFEPVVNLLQDNAILVGLAIIFFGSLVGVVSSLLAMGRHLRLE